LYLLLALREASAIYWLDMNKELYLAKKNLRATNEVLYLFPLQKELVFVSCPWASNSVAANNSVYETCTDFVLNDVAGD
jgi:hypothetical protein